MLKTMILGGLTATTVSSFMLGAVFAMLMFDSGATRSEQDVPAVPEATDVVPTASATTGPDAAPETPPATSAASAPAGEVPDPMKVASAAADISATPVRSPAAPAPSAVAADPPADLRGEALLISLEPDLYTLSAGSFTGASKAQQFAAELGALGMPARVESSINAGGQTWSEVKVGPYPSSGQAARAADGIRRAFGITPSMQAQGARQ